MHDANIGALDLNLLVALDALLRAGSVTAAAGKLGLSQPAMSHRLRRLRALFDDPLVVPGKRGLVATPRARQLEGRLRRALEELGSIVDSRDDFDPKTATRTFQVCSADLGDLCVMPDILGRLSREAPGLSIVTRLPWPGMDDALERGELDLIVSGRNAIAPGLVQRKVAETDWLCLARRDHPQIRGRVSLQTFVSLGHVLVSPTGSGFGVMDTALAERGLARRIAYRTPHFLGAPHIIAASDLVLTIQTPVAWRMAAVLPLQIFEPPLPLPRGPVYMTFHPRMQADAGHRWLRELTAECTREGFEGAAPTRRTRRPARG